MRGKTPGENRDAGPTVRLVEPLALIAMAICLTGKQGLSWQFQHGVMSDFGGAGEGIRTLDPNLGKVVLYP
jgi:hypothetical protein